MAAAELKLQVGLDLAFFRQQLAQLGNVAVGYQMPINIKFDRLGIQQELNRLEKNINRRKYRLEVATNIQKEIEAAGKLDTALSNLQGKEIGIKITGTLGKIAPKDATKIRNDLAEAVAGGAGKKILVDVSVRENAIGEELRAVRKALNEKITPKNGKILVATSIRSGITNEEAKEFRESVKRKVGNIIVNVTGSADQLRAKEAKSIRTSLYQSIISNGGKIKIPATLTIADSEVAAFQKTVNSKFAGITVKVKAEIEEIRGGKAQAQIEKEAMAGWQRIQEMGAARMSGGLSDPARRESLRQSLSGRDIGELRSIGEQLGVKGARRYSNVQNLIEKIVADASIEMVKKYLDPQAVMRNPDRSGLGKVLDTFARGIFHMLGMDPAAMMAAQKQKLLPPSISWPASAATPPSYQGEPGTMLPGAPAPTLIGGAPGPFGLLPRTTRAGAMGDMRRMLSQGAGEEQPGKLALSPEAAKARVDAIIGQYLRVVEVQIKEAFSAPAELKKQLNVFSYLAQSLRDAEQRVKQNKIDSAVDGLINALENLIRKTQLTLAIERVSIADLGANRPLLAGTSYPALPAAGETGKNRVRISTGNPFESLPLLPPAGGTTPRNQMPLHTVSTGAYVGQPPFMQAPSMPPSMAPPLSGQSTSFASPLGAGYFEVGKGLNAIKTAYGQTKAFLNSPNFPVTGAIAGLGGEFGNAVKQVLLFGTAYKALAFLTSLPGEAFEAAKALATYKNQLQAVTTQSQTFDKSLAFVDNLAARFNVPLDSARQGFVKLYASMEPAGFKQGQIENLFTGISKAAAAFGLSSDKVDRVNYAFAQMASKGQIMSEELKGQLGDVLPGALGLFAEAAQMTIPEFSKAMEDGAFKGKAMEQVLDNVSILLNNKFSKAASGAAKTLQGAVNQIQNNLKLMYESFTPIVNGAAAAFGPQVNGLIKDITATMKVLTSTFIGAGNGFNTLSPRAQAFYTAIKTLEPSLRQAGAAIVDLGGRLAQLIPALVQVLAATVSFAASPLGRAALLAAVAIGTLTASLAVLEATGIKAAIKSVYKFVGSLYAIPAATGVARIAIIGLKLAITGLFIGAILIGLDYVIGKILGIGDAAQQSIGDVKQLASELDGLSSSQDFIGLATKNKQAQNEVIIAERLLELYTKMDENKKKGSYEYKGLNEQQRAFVRAYGTNNPFESGVDFANKKLTAAMEKRGMTQKALNNAQKLADDERATRAKELTKLGKVDLDEDTKKKQNLESYYSLLDDLAKATTQAEVDRAEAEFNHKRDLINAEYDYREARANSFQSKAIAFQKEIFNIVSKQEEEAFKSQNKIKLAAGSVSGLSPAGGGSTSGGPTGLTSYITGDPNQKGKGYQPDHGTVEQYHDHLAFATRELAIQAFDKLTAADIKVTEFKGYGKGVTGPHSGPGSLHHQGLAMDVPGYQWGGTGAIGAKEYAGSARVRQVMGIGGQASAGAPRKVPGSEKREEISQRKTNLLTSEARAAAIEKEVSATEELRIATARYTASLLPTAEQGLQNQLLEQKINLTRAGASPSILEAQSTYARQELETNENIRINTLEIERLTAAGGKNSKVINVLKTANVELKASLPVSAIQLLNKAISEQTLALVERTRAAKRDAEDQSRVNDLIISGMTRQAAEAKIAADSLRKDYKKALEEATKQVDIAAAAFEVLAAAKRLDGTLTKEQTAEYNRLAEALKRAKEERDRLKGEAPKIEEGAQESEKVSTPIFGDKIKAGMATAQEELTNLTNVENILVKSANNIGNAFGAAFGQIIDGSMSVQDALGSMFKQIGQDFINMAMEIIAKQVTMIIFGMLMKALGLTAGASGGSSTFFGGGSPDAVAGGGLFTGAGPYQFPKAANGATFSNGIAKFAHGGIVNGPTLFPFADGGAMQMGLMGEAGPEAIMPLQRGADGALGVRAAMGGNSMGGSSSPILNMNFETSTINGVEYVSRDQLEAAMMQTRRQASSDGAKRGMAMTLDKIQQSPQTRRRIGM